MAVLAHTATEEDEVKQSTLDDIDALLADTDELLSTRYPGDRDVRQPIHTVYVPGHQADPTVPRQWGEQALAAVEDNGGMVQLAERVIVAARREADETLGLTPPSLHQVAREAELLAEAVTRKLTTEPIEDLRYDFEDGFGDQGDETEDAAVREAARAVVAGMAEDTAPAFVGIRFKCLEAATRARGLRTLDLFVSGVIAAHGSLPEGLVLTLPKVSTADQVTAMVAALRDLEEEHGLDDGALTFEVQVETPQLILGADGTVPVGRVLDAGAGRITSLHYGTYDYSASMGVAAAYQSMEHPVADFAKNQMMVAVAGTGVHLSDGSTNILPVGDPAAIEQAWSLHARLVRRHLRRGIYQGWDMHPHQLPTRFLSTFRFYREGLELATQRLRSYVGQEDSAVLDEPATAKALARYLSRGLSCGAHTPEDIAERTDMSAEVLEQIARTGGIATEKETRA
ncbi:HpcH/HpaI aldolase/citrate lyase family protein [Brevibacterium casei CIP 102111]|uniref:HpcH/HpaI aldolase/citrate lyase family protein n=2 Tax=Brevibacterium casei TaxID=33889 RepID=A0A2H1J1F3_9MICO|nr:HpcH/HpaI aldolase/citrate lyase family protein [Brevibacterium casei CIP 102111]VEW15205.1 Citrate lyase beta subunit [Brevibacterium casei]